MSYLGTVMSAPATGKKVKPEEVSLWGSRLQIDPASNAERIQQTAPWWGAASAGAETAAGQVGTPYFSRLFGQLENQASDELALGGQLSPDEIREATQGSRAAWQARGLEGSAPSAFGEVLNRINFSNQRKDARRAFATGVAGMGLQAAESARNDFATLAGAATAPAALAEGSRQFDLERDDNLRFNDKRAAVDIKIGKENAEAAKSAAKTSAFGNIISSIFSGGK